MRMRIAIAGTVIGTAAGIGIGRVGPLVADMGHRSGRGDQIAAGRRARPDADRHRDPRDHHRRAARGRLAVARPDGLRPRRLVQLRPARHARQERSTRIVPKLPGRSAVGDLMPTSPDGGLRGPRSLEPGRALVLYTRHRADRADRPRAAAASTGAATCRPVWPHRARSCGRRRRSSRRAGPSSSSRSTAAGRG